MECALGLALGLCREHAGAPVCSECIHPLLRLGLLVALEAWMRLCQSCCARAAASAASPACLQTPPAMVKSDGEELDVATDIGASCYASCCCEVDVVCISVHQHPGIPLHTNGWRLQLPSRTALFTWVARPYTRQPYWRRRRCCCWAPQSCCCRAYVACPSGAAWLAAAAKPAGGLAKL
jgi:hypothetical protein